MVGSCDDMVAMIMLVVGWVVVSKYEYARYGRYLFYCVEMAGARELSVRIRLVSLSFSCPFAFLLLLLLHMVANICLATPYKQQRYAG